MIDGVQLIPLTTHADERGFFREVIRSTDEIFSEGFGQWSHSSMYSGTIKAWHIHQIQTDWWYVPIGVIKAVLAEVEHVYNAGWIVGEIQEFLLGDNQQAQVLKIPPGVAHGLKVLQGPAHLFYITSREYDGSDEGRIPYNSLGYDWHAVEIK